MSDQRHVKEKVSAYLAELTLSARLLLLETLERGELAGDLDAQARLILEALRGTVRAPRLEDGGEPSETPRRDRAARAFFEPYADCIIGEDLPEKWPARISRSSLEPIWSFLCHDAAPDLCAPFEAGGPASEADLKAALDAIRRPVMDAARRAIEDVNGTIKARRRIAGLMGGERALQDFHDLAALDIRLGMINGLKLDFPRNLSAGDPAQEKVGVAALRAFLERFPGDGMWAAAVILPRLQSRALLPRLAVILSGEDRGSDLRKHASAPFIDIALTEAERALIRYRTAAEAHRAGDDLARALRDYHDVAKGLTAQVDLDSDDGWRRRMAAIRAQMSELVTREIEGLPARIRGVLKFSPDDAARPTEIRREAEEALRALSVLAAARACRDALAIHELVTRVAHACEQTIEMLGERLIEDLGKVMGPRRMQLAARVECFVAMARILFGAEYARLLRRRLGHGPAPAAALG
jgi:hypothetical protein